MITLNTIRRMSPSILSANDRTFEYDYLDNGEFRLIILSPERQDDPEDMVRCEMFTCLLNNSPPYFALSYAWGDVSDQREILMGREEITMSVPASLQVALRALRDPRRSVLLWADAISINQQNSSEKAEQVQLMTRIYKKAESVAIWLGPRSADSDLGMELIEKVSDGADFPQEITKRTSAPFSEKNFAAVVALFDRDYWHRLWVVQEVFNAKTIEVHCGPTMLPWEAFQTASAVFRNHRRVLERSFHPRYSNNFYKARSGAYSKVLIHEGPGSLDGIGTRAKFRDGDSSPDHVVFRDLLEVLRHCRRKLSSEPKDKVYGILGVLSQRIRSKIKVDYNIPVKDVYIHIFRTVVEKTRSLDVLCDSIHFPDYTSNNQLPSWVPDWSHITHVWPIATGRTFSASNHAAMDVEFTEKNKLKMSAIPLGTISKYGVAVGTLCTVNDYLMAFLQWRACLSHAFDGEKEDYIQWLKQRFCLALCLHYIPNAYESIEAWMDICYHVFASTIRERLPKLQMDPELEQYVERDPPMDSESRRLFLQEHIGSNIMGRCFCITSEDRIGLGTGFMQKGDVVVVPLGCSTPVVLRAEGDGYRFVGDVYVNGYMFGQAVKDCHGENAKRLVESYVIH